MQAHADHEVHVRDEGEELCGRILTREDGAVLLRPCGDGLRRPHVLGVLHGEEDDACIELANDGVADLGEDFLVVLPALPVAHGDADDRTCAVRPAGGEDAAPCLASDGMDAEHGVGGALHWRTADAEAAQLRHGALVTHGDEGDAVAEPAHTAAGKFPRDGADALCVEHRAFAEEEGKQDDRHIVVETAAARDVLEQAAAAADEEVGAPHGAEDSARVKRADRMDAVAPLGVGRVG